MKNYEYAKKNIESVVVTVEASKQSNMGSEGVPIAFFVVSVRESLLTTIHLFSRLSGLNIWMGSRFVN